MAVSCALYVRTIQYIFSLVLLLSACTVYHTATYCLFLQTNTETWHFFFLHEKTRFDRLIIIGCRSVFLRINGRI